MVCAIYPRKSKANDNSQSMEQQIEDCTRYINEHYEDATIRVYDGDYALTGHSTKKRKDFQRMMNDVQNGVIQVVVIMRYDRIARNMRDFCNLYHIMEENNCNLVSVSQQIDTSTPYGKNFMYQMAAMAELEWAIISERYKDTARYKIENGYAHHGSPPRGFMVQVCEDGKKRFVHNPDDAELVKAAFEMYSTYKSKRYVVRWIRENIDNKFTMYMFNSMLNSDLFFGSCRDNENYCKPYYSKEFIMSLRGMKQIKTAPSGRIYLFKSLIRCPYCNYTLYGYGRSTNKYKNGELVKKTCVYKYYKCKQNTDLHIHPTVNISESKLEKELLQKIDMFATEYICAVTSNSKNKSTKSSTNKKQSIKDELERLNYLFEKGRIKIEYYETRYQELSDELNSLRDTETDVVKHIQTELPDNWKDVYNSLSDKKKQAFWNSLLSKIEISKDKTISSVTFK